MDYVEWKKIVHNECEKLLDVRYYLNEEGEERYRAFLTLGYLTGLVDGAAQLLSEVSERKIHEKNCLDCYLNSKHLKLALKSLEKIAKREGNGYEKAESVCRLLKDW